MGKRLKLLIAGPGGAHPPNDFWCISRYK